MACDEKKNVFPVSHCALFDSSRPTYGTPKVLERAGLTMNDIDVFEFHEAFAVSYHNTFWRETLCELV